MTRQTQNPTSSHFSAPGRSGRGTVLKMGYPSNVPVKDSAALHLNAATQVMFHVLCKTAALATQTQGAQWSYMGSDFVKMRRLLQKQYFDMYAAVDRLGERLRSFGEHVPFDVSEILNRLHENGNFTLLPVAPSQVDLVKTLITNHVNLVNLLTQAIEVWETKHDQTTTDILMAQRDFHTKSLWMLRAAMAGSQGVLRRSFI